MCTVNASSRRLRRLGSLFRVGIIQEEMYVLESPLVPNLSHFGSSQLSQKVAFRHCLQRILRVIMLPRTAIESSWKGLRE
ncbi:unnamed protein product [Calypogeia fissa]